MTTAICSRCRERYHEAKSLLSAAEELHCGICRPRYPEIDWAAAAESNYHARTLALKESP